MPSQDQFYYDFNETNEFYASQEGLQRLGGMVIDRNGVLTADTEAMGQWGWQLSQGVPLNTVLARICQSDEWKLKHPGEDPPFV